MYMQLCATDFPGKDEIENLAKAIAVEDIRVLAEAMEIYCDLQKSEKPVYTIISEYVCRYNGTRYKLAQHLREAGYIDVSTR